MEALRMLGERPAKRRRIILMIAEKRDRESTAKLPQVMEQVQRLNATVYWLTYSPFCNLSPLDPRPRKI